MEIILSSSSSRPIYEQIVVQIKEMIPKLMALVTM